MRLHPLLALLALACALPPSVASADGWGRPGGLDGTSPFRDTCAYDSNCGAKNVSDAVLGGSFVAGIATMGLLAADRLPYADEGLSPDPVMVLEPVIGWSLATLPTLVTWQITRAVHRRPRPFTYDEQYVLDLEEGRIPLKSKRNHTSSFFSGHTSMTAANMFALATAVTLEEDMRFLGAPLFVAALVGTGAVGFARVQAGYHFVSDVTIGGLVGAGFGVMGPLIARQLRVRVQAARGKRELPTAAAAQEIRVVVPIIAGRF